MFPRKLCIIKLVAFDKMTSENFDTYFFDGKLTISQD